MVVIGRYAAADANLSQGLGDIPAFNYSNAHAGSFADIVSTSPGVSLNAQGGQFQTYSLRGYSRSRVRTEIDGVAILTDRRAGNSISFLPSSFIDQTVVYPRSGRKLVWLGSHGWRGIR